MASHRTDPSKARALDRPQVVVPAYGRGLVVSSHPLTEPPARAPTYIATLRPRLCLALSSTLALTSTVYCAVLRVG